MTSNNQKVYIKMEKKKEPIAHNFIQQGELNRS